MWLGEGRECQQFYASTGVTSKKRTMVGPPGGLQSHTWEDDWVFKASLGCVVRVCPKEPSMTEGERQTEMEIEREQERKGRESTRHHCRAQVALYSDEFKSRKQHSRTFCSRLYYFSSNAKLFFMKLFIKLGHVLPEHACHPVVPVNPNATATVIPLFFLMSLLSLLLQLANPK